MAFQAAPTQTSPIYGSPNFAQPVLSHGAPPPVFIRTFQAAPLPSAVNLQTIGYPIG